MAWTTPKTDWATGELVAASDLNAIGENMAALVAPPTAVYTTTADIAFSASTEFTDVDSDNLNLTISTNGGDVLVHFHGSMSQYDNRWFSLDVEVDGARLGGDDGLLKNDHHNVSGAETGISAVSFTHLLRDLAAGSHTFKLQWKDEPSRRAEHGLLAGAQFWVREI